jgi:hypothetical protein
MKVKDLILKLKLYDQELPVCIADWAEEYMNPLEFEEIEVIEGFMYIQKHSKVAGTFLCLG